MRKAVTKRSWFTKGIFLGLIALVFAMPQWAAAQTSFRGIVVFGTSLSDPGNAFALVGGTNTPPNYSVNTLLVPDQPYARGGHHFSNGATWIEQFARPLGLAGSVRPAFRGSAGATNFAVGGARAADTTSPFGLYGQVNAFLGRLGDGNAAPSDALYVIEVGGNDVRDALDAYGRARLLDLKTHEEALAIAGAVITAALTSIGNNVGILYARGARKFLVANAPDVGLTPAAQASGAAAVALATALSAGFNNGLDNPYVENSVLPALRKLPNIQITTLDVFSKLHEIVANAAAFGLTNWTAACIAPTTPPFECNNPDEYLFWDGIHPTAAVHGIVAQHVAGQLQSP